MTTPARLPKTLAELDAMLKERGVPQHAYSFKAGFPNEAYVIFQEADGTWTTYDSERGQKSGTKHFETQARACQDFYNTLAPLME